MRGKKLTAHSAQRTAKAKMASRVLLVLIMLVAGFAIAADIRPDGIRTDNGQYKLQTASDTIAAAGPITGTTLTLTSTCQATRLISSIANGTAPFTVTSQTKVTNLNVDQVDNFHASTTPTADYIPAANGSGKIANGWILTGSGNGLDADLLDGVDSTGFVTSGGDVSAIEALTGTGIPARTADNTWALRSLAAPAAGFSITNPAGVAGNPTFVLANDLAGVEGLSTTGIVIRTGDGTWKTNALSSGSSGGIYLGNEDGVAGQPIILKLDFSDLPVNTTIGSSDLIPHWPGAASAPDPGDDQAVITFANFAEAVQTEADLVIGTDVQAYDATLAAMAGETTLADRYIYFDGVDDAAVGVLTSFVRTLLDDANQGAAQSTLGVVPGTHVQAYDATLAAMAGETTAADRLIYFDGIDDAAVATFTATGRSIVDDASVSAVRTTLVIDTDDAVTFGAVTSSPDTWKDVSVLTGGFTPNWSSYANGLEYEVFAGGASSRVCWVNIPNEPGTVISQCRVKFEDADSGDGVVLDLLKRLDSTNATAAWTSVGTATTTAGTGIQVATLNNADETMAANTSYMLRATLTGSADTVTVYSVGWETTSRVY